MSYNDLVNVPSFGKKRENFDPKRGDIAFYCQDCSKTVEATQIYPEKPRYECPICKGHNISIGTAESIKSVYTKRR